MKNIVLIMTLIVSCLFAGCDSLANKSEDKLSQQCHNVLSLRIAEICGALQ